MVNREKSLKACVKESVMLSVKAVRMDPSRSPLAFQEEVKGVGLVKELWN